MASNQAPKISSTKIGTARFSLPWLDIVVGIWKLAKNLWTQMSDQGMYEVIDYRSTLELLDKHGRRARLNKLERVRYLQNNIMAYQDRAWGDG